MKRRDLIRSSAALVVPGFLFATTGCNRQEKVARTEPPPPTPEPTETPYEEASPTPDAEPSEIAPAEPAAPYGQLTDNQQIRVDSVMEALSDVNANETKRWTENLAYDETGAENELRVWESIADAYKRWNDERPGINDAAKQEAFNVLLTGSLVPIGDAPRYVKLSALSRDDAKTVLGLYTPPASPEGSPVSEESPSL